MRSTFILCFIIAFFSLAPFALAQSGRPLLSVDTEHPGTEVPPAPTDNARPEADKPADGAIRLPGSQMNMDTSNAPNTSKIIRPKAKKMTRKQKAKVEDEAIFPNDAQ